MEVDPTTLALDPLADAARKHEAPPDNLAVTFPFQSPLGGCFILFKAEEKIDGGRDGWLGGYLHRSGAPWAAPVNPSFAFELAAVKERSSRELLGSFGGCVGDLWQKRTGKGSLSLCKWSRLRLAVLNGCRLQMAVVVLPSSEAAASLEIALRIPSTPSGNLNNIGAMLDGPLTDVAVTAGGRTFRAHRVVLAAASPVFLSMLDGDMREAREAAVELVGADAGAVELLLRHVYGGATEVPVSLALQLYALRGSVPAGSGAAAAAAAVADGAAAGARGAVRNLACGPGAVPHRLFEWSAPSGPQRAWPAVTAARVCWLVGRCSGGGDETR
jgi:hypothetical protein